MVDIPPSVIFLKIIDVLQDIGVHDERLAAACRHPKAYFVELSFGIGGKIKWYELVGLFTTLAIGACVVLLDTVVELCKQSFRIGKISVQIDFGKQ